MKLGGGEVFLSLTIALIGLIGELKLYFNQSGKIKRKKWSVSIYGIALLVLICGIITPPDIFSNIILSGPLTVIYLLILRKYGFKKLGIDPLKIENK